jgi:tRNA dimethylallyltransferase
LALRFNGEVINGDAMQMYDGLPIITNKISVVEQKGIPHHLLGFITLNDEPWKVGLFKEKASQVIQEIRSRGKLPIVVGGSHYYTQSLLFEHVLVSSQATGEDQAQAHLSNEEILEKFPILDAPTETMLDRLREIDPAMADRWHPNDRRKIRRSLEIHLLTGRKASDIYKDQKKSTPVKNISEPVLNTEIPLLPTINSTLLFWVHSDHEILKERLDSRVDKMVEIGLLHEVRSMNNFLQKQTEAGITLDRSRGIWGSIGFKEFGPYLAALETGVESNKELEAIYKSAVEQTKAATRQYARRQLRWIRLKLMPQLSLYNASEQLFLLDGSDLEEWPDSVTRHAVEITEKFLLGDQLPAPRELSDAAKEFLNFESSLELIDQKSSRTRQVCELCNVVCVEPDQWELHINSRRHRAALKRQLKPSKRHVSPSEI